MRHHTTTEEAREILYTRQYGLSYIRPDGVHTINMDFVRMHRGDEDVAGAYWDTRTNRQVHPDLVPTNVFTPEELNPKWL